MMSGRGKLGTPWLWNCSRYRHHTTQEGVSYEVCLDGPKWVAFANGMRLGSSNSPRGAAQRCLRHHRGRGGPGGLTLIVFLLGAGLLWVAQAQGVFG